MSAGEIERATRGGLAGMGEVEVIAARQKAIGTGYGFGITVTFLAATLGLAFGAWPLVFASIPVGLGVGLFSWHHSREHPRIERRLQVEHQELAYTRQALEIAAKLPPAQKAAAIDMSLQAQLAQLIANPGSAGLTATPAAVGSPSAAPALGYAPNPPLVPAALDRPNQWQPATQRGSLRP